MFSYLRTLTTWHCPHSLAAAAAMEPISPARLAHSSKSAAADLLLWAHAGTDRRTDRRTDTVTFHRPCSSNYAAEAISQLLVLLFYYCDVSI